MLRFPAPPGSRRGGSRGSPQPRGRSDRATPRGRTPLPPAPRPRAATGRSSPRGRRARWRARRPHTPSRPAARRSRARPETRGARRPSLPSRRARPTWSRPVAAPARPRAFARLARPLVRINRLEVREVAHRLILRQDAVRAEQPARLTRHVGRDADVVPLGERHLLRRDLPLVLEPPELQAEELCLGDLGEHLGETRLL